MSPCSHSVLAGERRRGVIPSTVYAEYLLGEINAAPEPDLPRVRAEIDWVQVRIPRKLRISASKPLHHFLPMHYTWTVLMQLLSVSLVNLMTLGKPHGVFAVDMKLR